MMSEGLSLRAVAATMGVSKSAIQRDVAASDEVLPDGRRMVSVGKVRGLDNKVRPSRRVDTTERDVEIVRRRGDGETVRQIATAVGCSVGTVHRILKLNLT